MLTLFEHKAYSSSDIYPVDLPFRFKLTLPTEHCTNTVKTSAIISGKFLFIKISRTTGNLFEMKRPLAPH